MELLKNCCYSYAYNLYIADVIYQMPYFTAELFLIEDRICTISFFHTHVFKFHVP